MSAFAKVVLVVLLAVMSMPALAVQPTGSAAWSNGGWTNTEAALFAGPGERYDSVGTIPGGERVRVRQCRLTWCEISSGGTRGWTGIVNLSFGTSPWSFPDRAIRTPVRHGGAVCFYSGYNFSGAEICLNPGFGERDLKLAGVDNLFRSVKVGNGSALVCRDRNFRSYCLVINKDTPRLEGLLDGAITSVHIY